MSDLKQVWYAVYKCRSCETEIVDADNEILVQDYDDYFPNDLVLSKNTVLHKCADRKYFLMVCDHIGFKREVR